MDSSQPSGKESTPLRDSKISTPSVIDTGYCGHPQKGTDYLGEQVGQGKTHEERISELGLEQEASIIQKKKDKGEL